jgi:hypothetical protein
MKNPIVRSLTLPKTNVPKPYSNNFDNTSMYNVQGKIQIHIHTEKFNNNIRPKPTPIYKPVSTPNKDLSFFHPGQEVIRNDINKYKNIPHKDYIPIYVPPYYNIYESGFTNVRHADIFRKDS